MEEIFKKVKGLLISSALLFIVFGVLPATAEAATLYFSPSSGTHAIGAPFTVSVYISSADQAINAASGVISFPTDKLLVESISKSSSVFSLWVQEPSFSNSAGTVNFEGIVLNPGYIGSVGKVLTLNLRAKSAGLASLNFSSGSVLANDGKGTNILTSLGSASFNFESREIPVAVTAEGVPPAPKISSPTHPDESKWYNNSKPKFVWDLPESVIAARLLYDKNSDSRPTVLYEPPISEKELDEAKDGIYYFHAQLRNKAGWGKISHFKFQIDTVPPEPFAIKFVDGKEIDNSQPTIALEAKDNLSGIDYYKIKIGEGDFFDVRPEISASVLFTLPRQSPDKRTITVQAFDKAGNYAVATDEFIVKPVQPLEIVKESKLGRIQDVWSWTISLFIMAIILAGLVILFLFVFWWGRSRLSLLKKKVSKESKEAEEALHSAIVLLKEDIEKQVKTLETTKRLRNLTDEEEKIIKHFKKDLDDAEKFVRKEIKDIEQEGK
ncbi:MAG: hypothetical protein A3H02_02420 [Candidatus Niyogibacteria bacterium RIFCSPLOWO2_12_FULL_41_13]|uniref:Cohesin domain-containing protein n=1 Tax=Candidatus Niyogibacteria bacterium RIFCSPLOWO2_12_FULL_41_13 TaxID=1801726 RepID=A0A1G2F1M4_9BACT|nr:MAG: hypothetical protein A3H02_02420 [Candidatus Niyogibacteria bacterium RIFCSPLOWO2_12_FULL_41_13]